MKMEAVALIRVIIPFDADVTELETLLDESGEPVLDRKGGERLNQDPEHLAQVEESRVLAAREAEKRAGELADQLGIGVVDVLVEEVREVTA